MPTGTLAKGTSHHASEAAAAGLVRAEDAGFEPARAYQPQHDFPIPAPTIHTRPAQVKLAGQAPWHLTVATAELA